MRMNGDRVSRSIAIVTLNDKCVLINDERRALISAVSVIIEYSIVCSTFSRHL